MTSETEGRGRHDVRDRGEGAGMMSETEERVGRGDVSDIGEWVA